MSWQAVFAAAVSRNASDIHLQEGRRPMLRQAGELQEWGCNVLDAMTIRQWLQETGWQEKTAASSSFGFSYEQIRCRLQVSREFAGMHAVIRLLYPLDTLPADADEALLQRLAGLASGLVLLCGPTGSGKTTALWRMLQYVNRMRACHIITLEDPIEYVVSGEKSLISQRELSVHFSSFALGIKEALRQDPDILLIGEMRDRETMDAAITAAETGHLVFSTLHTPTAPQAVRRLAGAYHGTEQEEIRCRLALVLQGILAQRPYYRDGQTHIIREILLQTPAVAQLIRCGKEHQLPTVMQTSAAMGMRTMEQAWQRYRGQV